MVFDRLDDLFTMIQLEHAITATRETAPPEKRPSEDTIQSIRWLARSNYQLVLPPGADASELVIFPQTSNESRGIEDLRMVRFVDDDGSVTYYGTCTAFDGYRILPQLIETTDFLKIGVHTLNGDQVQNKGMALFPRRVGGQYVMCSRNDGENLYIMYSDSPYFWDKDELLQTPKQPWEFVQIGNCGSPLETPEGWLLLTHGVGPMRTYCVGAMLLDLRRSTEDHWHARRAADHSHGTGTRWLCAQRGLHLWSDDSQWTCVYPICGVGHDDPLFHGFAGSAAGSADELAFLSIEQQHGAGRQKSGGALTGGLEDASPAIWRLGNGGEQHC